MREPELGIAVSPRDWGERLHRFVADHGGARVRARIIRPEDVVEQGFDVLVVDDLTSYLSRRLVQTAQAHGKAVLGVFDGTEFKEGEQRLWALGVDAVVEASASPEEFLHKVGLIYRPSGDLDHGSENQDSQDGKEGPTGVVLVVGGPSGGVGRTEVAVALCSEWRRRGFNPALVDADELSPAIAQRLGLPLHPNLRSAVDDLQNRDVDVRGSVLVPKHVGFAVLSGFASSRDWAEVRPNEATELVSELAAIYSPVIVDIGSSVEDLSNHCSSERFRLSRSMIRLADLVVTVGVPTPVGLARLISWLAESSPLVGDKAVHCAFNRAAASPFQRREISGEFLRSYDPFGISFLPEDPRVSTAGWSGELVDRGPFQKAIAEIADSIEAAEKRLLTG